MGSTSDSRVALGNSPYASFSIGRTLKESLQKCLRSLEIGRSGLGGDGKPWRIGTEVYGDRDILPRDPALRDKLIPRLRDERIFFIRHALRALDSRLRKSSNCSRLIVGSWFRSKRLWILKKNWRERIWRQSCPL